MAGYQSGIQKETERQDYFVTKTMPFVPNGRRSSQVCGPCKCTQILMKTLPLTFGLILITMSGSVSSTLAGDGSSMSSDSDKPVVFATNRAKALMVGGYQPSALRISSLVSNPLQASTGLSQTGRGLTSLEEWRQLFPRKPSR